MPRENKKYYFLKNAMERDEYLKCQRSIVYFINTYVKITHPTKGKIPFHLYKFQIALLQVYCTYRYNITLKPRQMGVSTIVCAYVLWLAMFHPYKYINMISIKESIARNMLRKIKLMYSELPLFLQLEVGNGSTINEIGTSDRLAFVNGSEINALSATENAGRSDACSCLVMDEAAFQRYASGIWSAAQPSLSTGGQAILLSTAFGMGNFFHETYSEALQGLNGFHPVRLNWRMHPDRDMRWYEEQKKSLGVKRVAQEVDCDFLQSGFTVFDMGKIRAIEDRLSELVPQEFDNGVKIYHPFDPSLNYFIGADIASGRSRDFSAFSIMDSNGREHGCYKGKISVREFTKLLMKWGNNYGQAMLAPESNAIGEGVVAGIQEAGYPYIYSPVNMTKRVDEYDYRESDVFGWLTTGKSRNDIITGMDDDLNDDSVEMNNPYFVEESYTFVYSNNNKPTALGKEIGRNAGANTMYEDENKGGIYTDDAILGGCITNQVRKAKRNYRGYVPFAAGGGFIAK